MRKKSVAVGLLVVLVISCILSGCTTTQESEIEKTKEIVDMRGKTITIPKNPKKVVIVDKGFIVQTMVAMGIEDKIVASGGIIQSNNEKPKDRDSLYLFPEILDLPNIGYTFGGFDYETLAMADPDIVLWRNSEYIKDNEITIEAMDKIENEFQIPLVVINGSGCYDEPKLETHYEGVELIGKVFDHEERAKEIVDCMKEQISVIKTRTKDIADEDRPSVMFIGLRTDECVGVVWARNYGDAKFTEEVANIKNVYDKHERTQMSAEQIITLNPEVIILGTNTIKPDPSILYNDPAYKNLRDVDAVKNKKVGSLGLLTWWGDLRLELPTVLLISAKTTYPDSFEDINVGQWLNEYHKKLYNLSDSEAQELKKVQLLTWMDDHNF